MLRLGSYKLMVVLLAAVVFFALPAAGALAQASEETAAAEQTGKPADIGRGFTSFLSDQMAAAAEQFSEAGKGLLAIPGQIQELLVRAQNPENLFAWGMMGAKVVLVVLAGWVAAWIIRRFLSRARSRMEARAGDAGRVRIMFALGRSFLDILPIAGFAVAAYAVLPFTEPAPETRFFAVGLVSAAVISGVILLVSRMICLPDAAGRMAFFESAETGHYCHIWIRRITLLGIFGYLILEAFLLSGLAPALHAFLLKFLGLVVMVMLVIFILQNRRKVAAWICGRPPESEKQKKKPAGSFAGGAFLRFLADGWHIVAIVLVVGFYISWALEIAGGSRFLLIGLFSTLVVIFLAGVFARILRQGVKRLFHISDSLKQDYPGLEERLNRYQPLLLAVVSGVIYLVAAFAILEAWGLDAFGWLFSPLGGAFARELITLLLIIAGAFVLWEFFCMRIERSLENQSADAEASRRKLTLLPLLKNVVRITLIVITAMLVFSRLGINIGPLLAGAGVIGLAVGFGAQTLVQDMITGAFILLEDALAVGDWVEAGGHSGTVERLTVRTVTLRDLSGTVRLIPFSQVSTVTNYNRDYGYALIDAGVAYRERYGDVVQALQDTAAELRADPVWSRQITGDLEVFGLNNLGDSAVEIRVRLKTRPMQQFSVKRAFLERMKHIFDERGIEIPFPHTTVWFGADKDGSAPPMRLAMEAQKPGQSVPAAESGPEADPEIQVASEKQASEDVVEEAGAADEKK